MVDPQGLRIQSKARLTEKKLKRKNEQEITCLIFSLVAHHTYNKALTNNQDTHNHKTKNERSEITQRYLKIVQMLQINVEKMNMGKKGKSIRNRR